LNKVAEEELIANPSHSNLLKGLVIHDDRQIETAIIIINTVINVNNPSEEAIRTVEREVKFLEQAAAKVKEYLDIAGKSASGAAGKAIGVGIGASLIAAIAKVCHVASSLWPLFGQLFQHLKQGEGSLF